MPLTFFAHQVPVLPLWKWRPRWFDGTALCIGSMAPDLSYAFNHTPASIGTHRFLAQLWWSIPVTMCLALVVRHLWLPLFARLSPQRIAREMMAVSINRHPIAISMLSAWIGGMSHIILDAFTHANSFITRHVDFLRRPVFDAEWPLFRFLQFVGHTFGTTLGVLAVALLIQRASFSRGANPWRPPALGKPTLLYVWGALTLGALVAAIVMFTALPKTDAATAIIRAAWIMGIVVTILASVTRVPNEPKT